MKLESQKLKRYKNIRALLKKGKENCHARAYREGHMACNSKMKKLLEKYSLPDDATAEEVLRALNLHSSGHEVEKSDLYSKKCQVSMNNDEYCSGYD